MDDQSVREIDKNIDKGKDLMRRGVAGAETMAAEAGNLVGIASETIDQARTMARNAGEQAWSAASEAAVTAQDLARQAREQASAASETLYQQGTLAGEYLTRGVNQYPLIALLIAGGIGYLTAYLIHAGWPASKGATASAAER